MIHALMTNKNNPNVTMVIGIVKITRIGFTIKLSSPNTMATIRAATNPVTSTPGRKCAKSITIPAVTISLINKFILKKFN